ncbi:unnamed protein product [Amoebophrya sp. A120]|nr:unnamed protein product [Amoebophrya sp. A120]|eukprot:GSA120T00023706001.1
MQKCSFSAHDNRDLCNCDNIKRTTIVVQSKPSTTYPLLLTMLYFQRIQ